MKLQCLNIFEIHSNGLGYNESCYIDNFTKEL